ncbi:unnamed protein product [Ranitomeya imitator]|uniref:ribonuclease H n=1 Tax=Ranitomeya imitator TaxID=111125 RepID=A0ABN9MCR6_9NEOB|nr:unnamed protein product [Ranitomeya imitator]
MEESPPLWSLIPERRARQRPPERADQPSMGSREYRRRRRSRRNCAKKLRYHGTGRDSVRSRIQYKTTTLIHKALHGSAPPYISSLVSVYHPTRALRSANDLSVETVVPVSQETPARTVSALLPRRKRISTLPNLVKPRVSNSASAVPPSKPPLVEVPSTPLVVPAPHKHEGCSAEKGKVLSPQKSQGVLSPPQGQIITLPEKRTPVPQVPQFSPYKKSALKHEDVSRAKPVESALKEDPSPLKERPPQKSCSNDFPEAVKKSIPRKVITSNLEKERIKRAQKLRDLLKEELRREQKAWRAKHPIIHQIAELEKSNMRMRDFVHFIPMTNPMSSSLEESRNSEKPSPVEPPITGLTVKNNAEEEDLDDDDEEDDSQLLAPRVKVAEDGSIILDEESDSIATGSVPQDWRIANVVPIFKKGSKSEPGNYRPHGFMRNRSCQTNLISFYEEVSYRLDHGESLDVVYLDFSKAFDTVPHKRRALVFYLQYPLLQPGLFIAGLPCPPGFTLGCTEALVPVASVQHTLHHHCMRLIQVVDGSSPPPFLGLVDGGFPTPAPSLFSSPQTLLPQPLVRCSFRVSAAILDLSARRSSRSPSRSVLHVQRCARQLSPNPPAASLSLPLWDTGPGSGAQSRALLCAIHSLRQSGVIVPVPEHERFKGFYSNLFVVPKKDGKVRPILDLKLLNKCVRVRHFRMESLRSVISSMERGEFLASIDIKDAYLHIPIFPPHQRFFRFAVLEDHFQFTALPFGLATAPRVFTKVMAAVMAILHSRGVVVLPYLDDLLIKGPSFQACESSVHITLDSLSRLGWLINLDKSSPVPARRISFLGMILDTSRGLVLLPRSKAQALQQGARTLCHPRPRTIRFAMKILGKMVAAIEAVPFAQLHLRPLQQALLGNWDRSLPSLDRPCPLSPRVRQSLVWWTLGQSLLEGKSFLPIRWLVVTTDASLLGWGAVFLHHSAQGRWTVQESRLPINILEIRAIRLALSRFHTLLAGHPIRVQSDNVTAVAYINNQGGTRSRAAMQEVSHILRWAETNHSSISAVHIPGVENWAADFLSRQGLASGEWELHPEVFRQICLRWGTPDVDLMASRLNAKVHNFIARSRDPQAIGVDALIFPWHQFQLPYVFPPLPLLPKVIQKIKTEGVPVILVAPDWPRCAWYAELVQLVADVPWRLPDRPDLLRQGPICHQSSGALRLTAWLLKPGF